MADSVDRVFAQALQTVRRLPRSGSTRPPPSARLQLYGLYKQSMEGDVQSLVPRPPPPPPLSVSPGGKEDGDVTGRSSRRAPRDGAVKAEQDKWDAWQSCRGLGRTEAKRRYIHTLIETMKVYAAGTVECRELVSELEFVWEQIRGQTSGVQPERARTLASKRMIGQSSRDGRDGGGDLLRVLSPVSREDRNGIVEAEDVDSSSSTPDRQHDHSRQKETNDDDNDLPEPGPHLTAHHKGRKTLPSELEAALTKISTELAALREQLDELNTNNTAVVTSSSTSGKTIRTRRTYTPTPILSWLRWLIYITLRQIAGDILLFAILGLLVPTTRVPWRKKRTTGRDRRVDEVDGYDDWLLVLPLPLPLPSLLLQKQLIQRLLLLLRRQRRRRGHPGQWIISNLDTWTHNLVRWMISQRRPWGFL